MINKVFFSIVASIIFFISLGLNVVTAKNPVYSIFYLVLFFIAGSCAIAMFGCDYLALIFILVYVGAIAVLFLFVVMILDIKIVNKPTILHEIFLSDYLGHVVILFFAFYLLSPNFFILNILLAFFYCFYYSIVVLCWPVFDFVIVINDPIFSPEFINDPVFFFFSQELHKCFFNLLHIKFLEIEFFYSFFHSCSTLSVFLHKVLCCVDSWSWYLLPEDYFNVDSRVVDPVFAQMIICFIKCDMCPDNREIKYLPFIDYCENCWFDVGLIYEDTGVLKFLVDFDSSVKDLQILYTDFTLWFLLCGGILLVAMIGCISLALPSKQESVINTSQKGKFIRRIKTVSFKR